jgi:hypothetical protein
MIITIIGYLIGYIALLAVLAIKFVMGDVTDWLVPFQLAVSCTIFGGLGGCIYCLRAVYLNRCVRKLWDSDWHVWYFIRPLVSTLCGGVSYIFMKAGLLILESNQKEMATDIGFLALAFIAGLNVDKFLAKIEDVAQAIWGIEKSRVGRDVSKNENREGLEDK